MQAALTPCVSSRPTGVVRRAHSRPCKRLAMEPARVWVTTASGRPRTLAAHATASNIAHIDGEQLNVELENRDRPLIIDFYATWCGPCVLLAKELEQVAAELGDNVRILKIDTDENPDISSQLQIQGLPTLIFVGMDPSKPALRTEGLLPAQSIVEIVQNELGAPA